MSFYPASSEEEGQIYYQASSVSSSEKEGLDYISPLSLPSLEVCLKTRQDRPCSRSLSPPRTTTPVVWVDGYATSLIISIMPHASLFPPTPTQ